MFCIFQMHQKDGSSLVRCLFTGNTVKIKKTYSFTDVVRLSNHTLELFETFVVYVVPGLTTVLAKTIKSFLYCLQ